MPTPTSAQRGPFTKCQGRYYRNTGHRWVCTICPATHEGPVVFPNLKAALKHERNVHDRERSGVNHDEGTNGAGGMRVSQNRLDETCRDKINHPPLTSEGLRQWDMHAHVDHVFDLVPFWQRGIDAAEKGQVLRLEEFLEKMEGDGGWRTATEVLGMLGGKAPPAERSMWVQGRRDGETWESDVFDGPASQRGGWGAGSACIASDATESSRGRDSGWGVREEWAEGGRFKTNRGNAGAAQDGWAGRARVQRVQAMRLDDTRAELHHFVDAIARQEAVNDERRRQMHLFFEMPMEKKIQKIEDTIRFLRTHTL